MKPTPYLSKSFLIAFFFVLLFAASKIGSIYMNTNTSGIHVKPQLNSLDCASEIKLSSLPNVTAHYTSSNHEDFGFKSQICTFDKVFNGSDADRVHLYAFSHKMLEYS